MSTAPDRRRMSLREYVACEETSGSKHEFYRGEIFAMAGTTIRHNRISGNIYAFLHRLLEGRECEPFGSDQRIRIPTPIDLSTYPDISVICGELQIDAADRRAITNPRVIFEILSNSTESYDRGQKFEFYQRLESLQEYVLVEQSRPAIVHYSRDRDGTWRYRLIAAIDESLQLESIDCSLPLTAIYRNIEFGPESDEANAEVLNRG
jgi:Uma2 family endonuclease